MTFMSSYDFSKSIWKQPIPFNVFSLNTRMLIQRLQKCYIENPSLFTCDKQTKTPSTACIGLFSRVTLVQFFNPTFLKLLDYPRTTKLDGPNSEGSCQIWIIETRPNSWDPNYTPGVDFLDHNFLSSKNLG